MCLKIYEEMERGEKRGRKQGKKKDIGKKSIARERKWKRERGKPSREIKEAGGFT